MKVLFHFNVNATLLAWLKQNTPSDWEVICCPEDDLEGFEANWPGTQVLWHVLRPVTGKMIQANPSLALIQKIGVGVNTIDLSAAASRSNAVCNMPGVNSRAVDENTFNLMTRDPPRVGTPWMGVREGGGGPRG